MFPFDFTNLAFLGLIAVSLALLLTENWRAFLICLALQYLAVFALISLQWSTGLAAVKLITGWMACAILATTHPQNELRFSRRAGNSGMVFRFLAAMVVWLLVFSVAGNVQTWLPIDSGVAFQSLLLAGMGLLQIALSGSRLRIIVGLLSILSGFEIIYAFLSSSVLVTGLLVLIHLGLAMAGAYWMQFSTGEGAMESE